MMPEREESPDWLRSFQPPTRPVTTLSSSSSESEPCEKEEDETTCRKRVKMEHAKPSKRTKTEIHNQPVWALSSDSDTAITEEPIHDDKQPKLEQVQPKRKNKIRQAAILEVQKDNDPSTSKLVNKINSPLKTLEELGHADADAVDQGLPDNHIQSRVTSSTLPLLLPDKVSRSKVLVECEGESIDLSGDMGAVGRVIIPDTSSGEPEMFLDLKGTIYRTTIVPSRTFCVVSVGQSEAKIEAIMNDFVQLKAQSNVYDAETMVEGTLEGFSFESDDETDKVPKDVKADQNEGAEEQTGKKPKGKQEKKAGGTQKKGKAGGGKQLPKKRKPQATKKSKAKK